MCVKWSLIVILISAPWLYGGWTIFFLFFFLIFFFFLIVIQLQMYAFSPHPSTPPEAEPFKMCF